MPLVTEKLPRDPLPALFEGKQRRRRRRRRRKSHNGRLSDEGKQLILCRRKKLWLENQHRLAPAGLKIDNRYCMRICCHSPRTTKVSHRTAVSETATVPSGRNSLNPAPPPPPPPPFKPPRKCGPGTRYVSQYTYIVGSVTKVMQLRIVMMMEESNSDSSSNSNNSGDSDRNE